MLTEEAIAFLRKAAAELRDTAERSPEIATDLLRMADELDGQAEALSLRFR